MIVSPVPPPVVVRLPQGTIPPSKIAPVDLSTLLATDLPPASRSRWRMFPPWLLSFVLHLNVLILLGLWIGASDLATRVGEVEMSWSEGSGGELLTTLESAAPQTETLLEAAELTPPALEKKESPVKPEVALKLLHTSNASAASSSDGSANGGSANGESTAGSPGDDRNATRTSIFGIEGKGKKFVYVFDRSSSMNSGFELSYPGRRAQRYIFLDGAKQELLASLNKLNEHHQFQIIFYNDRTQVFQGFRGRKNLIPATPRAKELASTFIYQLEADGDTYHTPALVLALRLKPDVIFLLTDGEEKDDPSDGDIAELTRQNKGRTAINVIQICREPRPDGSLVQLARENGGQHTFLDVDQLFEAMNKSLERQSLVD